MRENGGCGVVFIGGGDGVAGPGFMHLLVVLVIGDDGVLILDELTEWEKYEYFLLKGHSKDIIGWHVYNYGYCRME